MAKIRIDGEYFEFDRNHKPMAEMLALEKATGISYGEWEAGLDKGSAQALAALIWLVWKRAGREKPFEEILASDLNLGDLSIEPDAAVEGEDPTTAPDGTEASPSTGSSTSARSRKS